jgi:serine/threonine-protein kinase MRCK
MSDGEKRLKELETLFLNGPAGSDLRPSHSGRDHAFISIETLLDVLLLLYDECTNSSLRREKTVSEFIQFGKPPFTIYPSAH